VQKVHRQPVYVGSSTATTQTRRVGASTASIGIPTPPVLAFPREISALLLQPDCTVLRFEHEFSLEDAIESHAFARFEELPCV
jgi:hypothetical protein